MNSAVVGNSDLELRVLEMSKHISSKCRAWQTMRIDTLGDGMNVIVEIKGGWELIVRVLGITAERLILSVLPGRKKPFCVMIDGDADTQQWFTDIEPALLHFIWLM